MRASSSTARNPGIDALRGLSIFLVVIHHLALRIPLKQTLLTHALPRSALSALSYNGYEAVFVFFVISGFLIASNTLMRWGKLGSMHVGAFYVRRASRILPCLLALVGVLSLFHALGFQYYVITHPNQSLGRAVFSALGLHLNWYEGRTGYLPGGWDVLWSLSIEEVFYLAFPIVCLTLDQRILIPVLFLLAASLPFSHAALVSNEIWQEKAYLPGMAAIATGILAALFVHRFRLKNKNIRSGLQFLGTIGIVAVFCAERLLWPTLKDSTLLVLTLSTAYLLIAVHAQQTIAPRSGLKVLAWLRSMGRLSYEIYLTHMFVVFLMVRFFKTSGANLPWGFLWFIPTVFFSWALGAAFSRYFSVPAERALLKRQNRPMSSNLNREGVPALLNSSL